MNRIGAFMRLSSAYLTVYLTLTMTIVLSLYLALIEGARQNAFFLQAECVTDIALNSALAEYHRELWEQYNLFAIDSSYGTSLPQISITGSRIAEYINQNLSTEDVLSDWLTYRDFVGTALENVSITEGTYLTDGNGAVFRRRAAEAVWDDMNLDLYEELQGWIQVVESEKLRERDIGAEKDKVDKELDSHDGEKVYISETEWTTVDVENPTDGLESKRKKGILSLVVEDQETISSKSISTENLIEARAAAGIINQGNQELEELSEAQKVLERFFFQEYLLRYMSHYGTESEDDTMSYQVEYLIAGNKNDTDNLRSVANSLLAMREVANTIYLFADKDSRLVAKGMATTMAITMGLPILAGLIENILLFGWAFAESVYDLKCLLAGEKIPLIKDSASWHYDLQSALKLDLGTEDHAEETKGLSYEDYLRILLFFEDEEELTMRAMNVVEADIRATEGNEHFRLDGCLDSIGVVVRYKSAFGYECEITREKGYSTQ